MLTVSGGADPTTIDPMTLEEVDLRRHQRDEGPVVVRVTSATLNAASEVRRDLHRLRLVALVLLVALNLADIVTTEAFLDAGVEEANPVGGFLISHGLMAWVKLTLLALLGIRLAQTPPRIGTTCAMWFVVGIYACVIAVNLQALNAVGAL